MLGEGKETGNPRIKSLKERTIQGGDLLSIIFSYVDKIWTNFHSAC